MLALGGLQLTSTSSDMKQFLCTKPITILSRGTMIGMENDSGLLDYIAVYVFTEKLLLFAVPVDHFVNFNQEFWKST